MFRRGAEHLRKTKLTAWVKDTTTTRSMDIRSKFQATNELPTDTQSPDLITSEEMDSSADEVNDQAAIPTLGYMCIIDGELVIDSNIENFQLDEDGIDFGDRDEFSFDPVE